MWLLSQLLRRGVQDGRLTVRDAAGGVHEFGPGPQTPDSPPDVAIRLTDKGAAFKIARDPALGAAEAYMDGRLELEDGSEIYDLLKLVTWNFRWARGNELHKITQQPKWKTWLDGRNHDRRAKRNVAHHYDLSDRLYDLFLDADRQYSCAYWRPGNQGDLARAQQDKMAHIAAKLLLEPGQRVLDIGSGWGGLALYLHKVSGVDVLGVTLSEEQLAVANQRAEAAGVADHVKFELIDYRKVTGAFDRVVSVGMFEHVGLPHYQDFFDQVADRLTPEGVALVHSIGRAAGPGATDSFMAKYIFPGGYAPALSQVLPRIEQAGLWTTDIEILRGHYALTTEAWYRTCVEKKDEIIALYDERFWRMWTFYLAGAAMAFRHMGQMVFQAQLSPSMSAVPATRDYIGETEQRYAILAEGPAASRVAGG
ncbi:MAG: cyclopropane-fatty-acyl-phospholipid synthase family protein [Pseudomonadota bacterium]